MLVASKSIGATDGFSLKYIPALDGLRALAVALVVGYHLGLPLPGGEGVLIFFVISGFLITWLLLSEFERSGAISLRRFYARRALRIFPAFYAFWFAATCVSVLRHKPVDWSRALASATYVMNYYQAFFGHEATGYSHTWSLAVEEQFYLIWPVIVVTLAKRQSFKAVRILPILVVLIWLYRWFLQFWLKVPEIYIYEAFDARADHLIVGGILAFTLKRGVHPAVRNILTSPQACLVNVGLFTLSNVIAFGSTADYRNAVAFVIDPILVCLLLYQAVSLYLHPAWSWLNWSWVRYLGRISYSVYLFHGLTSAVARKALKDTPTWMLAPIELACIILVAGGSYRLIERPCLQLKDRFADAHSQQPP